MILRPSSVLGALALVVAGYGVGFIKGHGNAVADHKAEKLSQIEAGQKLEEKRMKLVKERDNLQRQLEEQANATPVMHSQCLGVERVRRLDRLQ